MYLRLGGKNLPGRELGQVLRSSRDKLRKAVSSVPQIKGQTCTTCVDKTLGKDI